MYLGQREKQPAENRRVLFNYAAWLGDVERLAENSGVAVVQRLDGKPLTAGLDLEVDGPYLMNERTALAVYLLYGRDGVDYKVTCRGETDQGQIREDEFVVQVREI